MITQNILILAVAPYSFNSITHAPVSYVLTITEDKHSGNSEQMYLSLAHMQKIMIRLNVNTPEACINQSVGITYRSFQTPHEALNWFFEPHQKANISELVAI